MFDFNKVKVIGATKPLVDYIPDSEGILSYAARVSNPSNQENFDTAEGLLKYCVRHKHYSVFETCSITMEIETPRDIARQILRHRSFSFQEFCIAGDSLVTTITKTGVSKKVAISDLYKRYQSKQYWGMSDNLVRVFDESDKTLKPVKIKEVFQTGIKPVYMLTLENGKKIKSTLEHKFLTVGGFKQLSDITEDDFVASNGVAVYQDYDWLKSAKDESISDGSGVQGIADKAGVSYHTIRKWLKKLNLSFTNKEVASYTEVWNKKLPKELQPMFGKSHSEDTRGKMQQSSLRGYESNLYSTGGNNSRTFRKQVADYWYKRKLALYNSNGGLCSLSKKPYSISELEIDHIKPVSQNPELAYEISNIQLIHRDLHTEKTSSEVAIKRMTVTWQKVASVEYVGEEQTYDLEVEHESHNYVANGIVTHNSQRYAESTNFIKRECRMQDDKNRQNSLQCDDEVIKNIWNTYQEEVISVAKKNYKKALELGVAKEVARTLLPEGMTVTKMYMQGSVRSWIHFIQVRDDEGVAQKEVVDVARKVKVELLKLYPFLESVINNNSEESK